MNFPNKKVGPVCIKKTSAPRNTGSLPHHSKQATPPLPEHKHCPGRPALAVALKTPLVRRARAWKNRAQARQAGVQSQETPHHSQHAKQLGGWRRAVTCRLREGESARRPRRASIAFVGTRHTSLVRTFLAISPFDVSAGARRATLCHVDISLVPEVPPLHISYGPFFASSLNRSSTVQPSSRSVSFVRSIQGSRSTRVCGARQ